MTDAKTLTDGTGKHTKRVEKDVRRAATRECGRGRGRGCYCGMIGQPGEAKV
jgi:hypothetical protein